MRLDGFVAVETHVPMTLQAHIVVQSARRAHRAGVDIMTRDAGQHVFLGVFALLESADLRFMAAFAQESRGNRVQLIEIVDEKPASSTIADMKISRTMAVFAAEAFVRPGEETCHILGVLTVMANETNVVRDTRARANVLTPRRPHRTCRHKDHEACQNESQTQVSGRVPAGTMKELANE
jgi:hypothetical protein